MSENTEIRSALESLAAEPLTEQIDYYRKPFMVLWAAIQEAASDVAEDYDLPADMAQLWVAEQMRQVADSLVDRLASRVWATMPPPRPASSLTTSSIPWNNRNPYAARQKAREKPPSVASRR